MKRQFHCLTHRHLWPEVTRADVRKLSAGSVKNHVRQQLPALTPLLNLGFATCTRHAFDCTPPPWV